MNRHSHEIHDTVEFSGFTVYKPTELWILPSDLSEIDLEVSPHRWHGSQVLTPPGVLETLVKT
jgi:hypothetical protein